MTKWENVRSVAVGIDSCLFRVGIHQGKPWILQHMSGKAAVLWKSDTRSICSWTLYRLTNRQSTESRRQSTDVPITCLFINTLACFLVWYKKKIGIEGFRTSHSFIALSNEWNDRCGEEDVETSVVQRSSKANARRIFRWQDGGHRQYQAHSWPKVSVFVWR